MSVNKKILILGGANGRYNLGDDAMFESLILAINPDKKHKIITDGLDGWNLKLVDEVLPFAFLSFKNVRLKWLTCYLRFYSLNLWLFLYKYLHIPSFDPILNIYIKKIKDCDLVIFAGMGAMTDKFGHYGIVTRGIITKIAHFNKIPVVISGNGIGPIRNKRLISVAKKYINNIDKIFVRDKVYSKKELLALNYPEEKIVEAIDDAFFYKSSQDDEIESNKILKDLSIIDKKFVVVNLHDWNSKIKEKLFKKVYKDISSMTNEYKILLLPNYFSSRMDDREILGEFQKYLESKKCQSFLLKKQISAGIAKNILKKSEFSIATRYHIGVFSLSVGVPTILVMLDSGYYIQKMIGILDWYGLEKYALDWQSEKIAMAVNEISNSRSGIMKKINAENSNFDTIGFRSAKYIKEILNGQ